MTTVLGTGADEQRVDGIMDEFGKKFMLDCNMYPRLPSARSGRSGARAGVEIGLVPSPSSPVAADPARPVGFLHDSGCLRHPRIEQLRLDGLGLRDHPQPDGRRRADQHDPVGGISIGLVQVRPAAAIFSLTDIIGDEDHFGDMDFKVAGTQRGVTGIQLDLKNQGITEEIIKDTLDQAKEARLEILRSMLRAIKAAPRGDLRRTHPG